MRLESVSVRYTRGGPRVLDDITLDLASGTVTAVVGGNGSGKSTLLKVAAGLRRPSSGSVRGRPDRIGYVPERLPANMRLSARSYLLHMGRVQGLRTADAARRGGELLDRLGIEGDVDAPISTLSKGNAQKVALAQAMLGGPRLLILDEPWSGLDARTHQVLVDCLAEWRAAGVVVLLTEHRPGTVAASADAVHRLHRGRLTEEAMGEAAPEGFAITLGVPMVEDRSRVMEALRALPGVRSVGENERRRICLEVGADRSDAVLAEVLRQGHSVFEVRPGAGGHR
ncbi:ABC transporter ATP-binding protein [Streptomyces hesseae]|uniref:ABC transporter ATP-binding protein n=1 Tax=Streptomyces hesseae TaxID=3075519 RepID=A0ABU2SY27_9ACTN|nr:ABC transporter ATP-binding protein [Streptomyces sp. DSM 40473]MDT0453496.1 ABC transporter ATP-binding protein [Streptomyces sp. DSM 40473]